MGLSVQDIKACATTLYGFSGEGIASTWDIELPVTLGEYPVLVTKMFEFIAMDTPSAYNILLGRPTLIRMGAVTSIRHLVVKFPMPSGIGILKGYQLAARECCYNISMRGRGQTNAQALVIVAKITEEMVFEIENEEMVKTELSSDP
ncbi:uncharacterized protein LOC133814158 [Humulus lupulus]|uniref:uncharacterized protein LOC133814158 n=1 Tax=Humulus lupulus TaxID=3486 RepID=UPI002B40A6F3|nr:uncharacterized protein LOC133814158 [Humulus lupulus]